MEQKETSDFEDAASGEQTGLLKDVWLMLCHNKKFWLIPIILGLLVFGLLVMLGGSAAAPFIYTLF